MQATAPSVEYRVTFQGVSQILIVAGSARESGFRKRRINSYENLGIISIYMNLHLLFFLLSFGCLIIFPYIFVISRLIIDIS